MTEIATLGITKAITNLTEAHAKLGVSPSPDKNFFTEWKELLPTLTDEEKAKLEHLKQRYLYYADSGAITKGTVNLILLSPLLETLNFFDPPYQVRSEKYVRFEIEDGDIQLDELIDALVIRDSLWLIVIETIGSKTSPFKAKSFWKGVKIPVTKTASCLLPSASCLR